MSGISLKIKLGGGGKASANGSASTNGKSNATATTGGRDAGSTDADGNTRNGSSHSLTSSRSATHAAATVPSTGAPHGPVRIKLHLGSASRESLTGKTALEMDDATLPSSSSYYDEDEEGDSDRAASDNAASSGDDTDIDDSNENYTGQGHAYNDDSDGSQSASEHSQQHTKLTINLGARRPPSADQEEEHVASHGLPSNDHAPRASSTVPQKRPGGRRRAPLTLKRRTTSSAAARGTSMQQPVRKKKLSPFLEQTIASLIK